MSARRVGPAVWAITGLIVFLLSWELWVRTLEVKPFITVEPSRILDELFDNPAFWLEQTWITAWHTLAGLGIALVAAVLVGAVLATVRPLEWATQPILVVVMVTPWVAYITSIVNWLGRGTPTIVFLVAFVCFPPFVFAATQGMRSADPAVLELLASVDTPDREVFWRVRLPSAMPNLFTAARFATGLGLAAAYFAEGGSAAAGVGLGEVGRRASSSVAAGYPVLWGSIVCAALLGVLLLVAVTALERTALGWHASQR
jgi:NitT/TauT family transport system permease protein